MGSTPSLLLNMRQSHDHFSVIFGNGDMLRLIFAPIEIIKATENILQSSWEIQNTNEQPHFNEFKLKGHPFSPFLATDKNVKYLICQILKVYYSLGRCFKVSSNLQRIRSSADVVMFEKNEKVNNNNKSVHYISVELNNSR